MINNLSKLIIDNGGTVNFLMIPSELTKGVGLCNPSICKVNNELLVNLRNVEYALYHSENQQNFPSMWGPLAYIHEENDMHLRTTNFLCKLNSNTLEIEEYNKIDTTELDVEPLWEFIGLEDGRLVNWDSKLYLIGVRRDTTPTGVGRMEYSEIVNNKEIKRTRIDPPGGSNSSYCEKNWMPVSDIPNHFVKWTNPTEVVEADLENKTSKTKYLTNNNLNFTRDLRGGSQVIPYKGYHIALVHEVNLFNNEIGAKDGQYYHRFIVWDKDWNIVKFSDDFKFFTSNIEFGCGLVEHNESLLVTVGFQDSSAFLITIPNEYFDKLVGLEKDVKLNGLPTINYISFIDDYERREKLEKQLNFYKLKYTPHISIKDDDENNVITGQFLNQLDKRGVYCLMSHLKAIKKWYNETEEQFGFFIEDDFSFETVKYWNFSWNDFISSIDEEWDCLQLVLIKEKPEDLNFKLLPRGWNDWSVTGYFLTRNYAKYLLDRFYKNDEFTMFLKNNGLIPIIENVIYSEGKVFSFPLFIEDIKSITTTFKRNNELIDKEDREYNQSYHNECSLYTLNKWKNENITFNKGKNFFEKNIIKKGLIYDHINNPYDIMSNFNLGEFYLSKGHLASSLSFFLRSAEYGNDKDIIYESLLKIGIIFGKLKGRPYSEKGAFLSAISFYPERPEGYSLLCSYFETHKSWHELYTYSKIGEMMINNEKATLTNIGYPGNFIFKFFQALSCWYISKNRESRKLFLEMYENYYEILPEFYKNIIINNLNYLGYSFESHLFIKNNI